jgi:hypothetical protein
MSTLSNAIHGVIRGRTVELAEECGLPDGQRTPNNWISSWRISVVPAAEFVRR